MIFVCVLATLPGCALSPQTITIDPALQADGPKAIGQGRTLALEVVDSRPSPIIGERGGVYPETSSISTTGDITPNIWRALSGILSDYQFSVVEGDADGSLKMKVVIESIDYVASGGSRVTGVTTSAVVGVVCVNGTREFTGRYRGNTSRDVFIPPDTEENQKLINETLAKVLDRVVSDEKLLEFISQ
jgi:uncharacterized lipoprotein